MSPAWRVLRCGCAQARLARGVASGGVCGATRRGAVFCALDATALALRRRCCDWALDKGTLDALSCAAGARAREPRAATQHPALTTHALARCPRTDGGALVARAARAALRALAPGGAALCVSARPADLLRAMQHADDSDAAADATEHAGWQRALAGARIAPLNAGGAGVLILTRPA